MHRDIFRRRVRLCVRLRRFFRLLIIQELFLQLDYDFLPEEEAKKIHNDDKIVMETESAIINKIKNLTDQYGDEHWISETKIPRYGKEGTIVGTMGISRDITKLKKLIKDYPKVSLETGIQKTLDAFKK